MPKSIAQKPFGQDENGNVAFYTERAQFQNLQEAGASYDSSKDCVGHWTSETALVYWTFAAEKPGTFNVSGMVAGLEKSEFTVELAGQTKNVKIPATGNYEKFELLEIGNFNIQKPGEYQITFKPVAGYWNPINMRAVQLKLAKWSL